jgi:hypothetical protein
MGKIKKYLDFINEELGIKDAKSLFKQYKNAEIYFHQDLDGVCTALGMKNYLQNNGVKVVDCHIIQYGSLEHSIPAPKSDDILPVLVDFAHFKTVFKIGLDHHDKTAGADAIQSAYTKHARSNVEIISGEIPKSDAFPNIDVESIKTVDSANFVEKGISPDVITKSVFSIDKSLSAERNRFLMGFVVNRLMLAYKNKSITVKSLDGKNEHVNKNILECLVMDCSCSLYSLFNNLKHYINNATAENWNKQKREYELTKLASPEELEKNHKAYVDRMKNYKDMTIDNEYGIASSYGGGTMFDPGSYDRYTVFKNNPQINFNVIVWPMGLIQASCNPFKEKILKEINLGAIAKEVLEKYEPKFKKIYVSLLDVKMASEIEMGKRDSVDIRHGRGKIKRIGFTFGDLVSLYKSFLKHQPGKKDGDLAIKPFDPEAKSEYNDFVKIAMDKIHTELNQEERTLLKGIKISAWDVIMANSGGHKSITNISGLSFLAYRKDGLNLYFGTYEFTDVMKLIQKELVETLKQKIDATKAGQEIKIDTEAWGNIQQTD